MEELQISLKTGRPISKTPKTRMPDRKREAFQRFSLPANFISDQSESQTSTIVSNVKKMDDIPASKTSIPPSSMEEPKITEMGDAKPGNPLRLINIDTASREESERLRQEFVDEKLKETRSQRCRMKLAVNRHLKRMSQRRSDRKSPPPQSSPSFKQETKLSRSSTFVIHKGTPDRGETKNSKYGSPGSARNATMKNVDSGQRKGVVKMNRAAILRLERMKKAESPKKRI